MSGGSGENTRGLPNGIKTRDELKALILKHGFLAESEVLAHINRTAKPVWTHNDFVNFFQTSGQMVFQVKNNHLYLAPSDDDSSDGETCDIRSTLSVRNKTQSSNTVGTRNLTESFSRGMTGLGSNGASYSASGSSERRKEPRLAARNRPSSSSSDEDNTRSGGHRKPGSSGAPKALPLIRPPPGFERRPEYEAVPYGTDEEEGETHRLDSKVDVFKLVNSHRRCYRSPADADQMVTMDPDPANKVVPKINLGTKPDDDSSNDSDDENSDSGRPTQIARNRPPPGFFTGWQRKPQE